MRFGASKIWGEKSHLDPKGDFFQDLFLNEGLVDIALPPYMPTWRNNKIRVDVIEKRLDRFLVSKSLVEGLGRYRMRVDKVPMFDHFPITMQLDPSREKVFILYSRDGN